MTEYVPVDRCAPPRIRHSYKGGAKECLVCGQPNPYLDKPPPKPRVKKPDSDVHAVTQWRRANAAAARKKELLRRIAKARENITAYDKEKRHKWAREHARKMRAANPDHFRDISQRHQAKEKLKRLYNPDYDAACRKRHTDYLKRLRATDPEKWERRRQHQLAYHTARYHRLKHDKHWLLKKQGIRRMSYAASKSPQAGLECLARHRKQYEVGKRWREAKLDELRMGAWLEFKQAQVELERWCWAFDWMDRWQARLDAASQKIVGEEKIG